MASRPEEITRTTYAVYLNGGGGVLIQPRTYRKMPSREEIAEQLAAFNYTKKPEYHATGVTLVVTETRLVKQVEPSEDELRSATARLQQARATRRKAENGDDATEATR